MNCPICSSSRHNLYKYMSGYTHLICSNCSHIYVAAGLSLQHSLDDIYSLSFYENYCNGIGYDNSYSWFLKYDFQEKVKLISKYLPVGSSILEVGGGPGYFAKLLEKAGYHVTVVEMTVGAQEYSIKHVGFTNILDINLKDSRNPLSGTKFDAVVSWAVIEHVVDPHEFYSMLRDYVKSHGFLFVDTGITTRIPRLVDNGYSSWLAPPYHMHVFSRKSFSTIFKLDDIIFFSSDWARNSYSTPRLLLSRIRSSLKYLLEVIRFVPSDKPGLSCQIALCIARRSY